MHKKSKNTVIWWNSFLTCHTRNPEYSKNGNFKRSNKMYLLSYSTEKKKKREKKKNHRNLKFKPLLWAFHTSSQKFRVACRIERLKTRGMLKFYCFQAKITALVLKMHKFWKLARRFMRSLRMHWKIIRTKNYLY